LNIPVTVPLTFGLLNRRVPKWSAVGAITWGLITGVTTRLLLGWDIGPQVYLAFAMTLGIYISSRFTARLFLTNKSALAAICAVIAAGMTVLFLHTEMVPLSGWEEALAVISALALGGSLFGFAKLFTFESEEDKNKIAEFFRKIDTPVDVKKEVYGAGRKQVMTMPLVGGTTIVMGLIMSMMFFTDLSSSEQITLGMIIGIMIVFGIVMWSFGKRTARKYAEESGSANE
jgi:hypothetical protein